MTFNKYDFLNFLKAISFSKFIFMPLSSNFSFTVIDKVLKNLSSKKIKKCPLVFSILFFSGTTVLRSKEKVF